MRRALVAAVAAGALAPAAAPAADPGRWTLTGRSTVPLEYYQGLANDGAPRRSVFFAGIHVGLYRTDDSLRENGRNNDVIPLHVTATEGYNHIGDVAYDAREGGRVLLPVECYYPETAPTEEDEDNPCKHGAIGVADPRTLQWRYYVRLDPAEIPKAMWAAISPDGQLMWTQSGRDLLAYRLDEISAANAAPAGPRIRAVRRVPAIVPPSGITGAHFHDGRLYVAGQDNPVGFQVWSIDLDSRDSRLEIERAVVGESEGLDFFPGLGGLLHWIVAPYNTDGVPSEGPFYTSQLLHFAPRGTGAAGLGAPRRPERIRLSVTPRRVAAGRWTRIRFVARARIAGRLRPLRGVRIRLAGKVVHTDRRGRASMRRRLPRARTWRARAARRGLRTATVTVRVVRR